MSTMDGGNRTTENQGRVIDLNAFRVKKMVQRDRSLGLTQAFVPAPIPQPTLRTTTIGRGTEDTDLSVRIDRIKTSIQRINQLMSDLRGITNPTKPKV